MKRIILITFIVMLVTSFVYAAEKVDLFNDGCLYEELGKGSGSIKGYVMIYETPTHKIAREAQTLAVTQEKAAKDAEVARIQELKISIAAKLKAAGYTEEEINVLLKDK